MSEKRDFDRDLLEMGRRIKKVRKDKGLTMSTLAEAAAVTAPHISMIERGLIRPSLAVISRLAAALGISESVLLSQDITAQVHVTRAGQRQTLVFEDASSAQMLAPTGGMMVNLVTGEEGTVEDMSVIHTYDEYLLVLEGEIDYLVGETTYSLQKGDGIYIPAGIRHQLVGERWRHALMLFVSPGENAQN